jgi:large conductance mechanosensitive channel
MQKHLEGFMEFVKEQGVVGVAIAFVVGAAITKLVAAFVTDIVNPFIGLFLGQLGNIQALVINIGPAQFMIGDFLSALIDFLVIMLVVYVGFKLLKLEKLDKKKE